MSRVLHAATIWISLNVVFINNYEMIFKEDLITEGNYFVLQIIWLVATKTLLPTSKHISFLNDSSTASFRFFSTHFPLLLPNKFTLNPLHNLVTLHIVRQLLH